MQKETKRERFVRIAEARTNKVIDMIRLLGNCSSRTNYEYNDDDINKIFAALDREIKNAKNKFNGAEQKCERFTLK